MNKSEVSSANLLIEKFQPFPFLQDFSQAEELSNQYDLPLEDVILISLNCSGFSRFKVEHDRCRLIIKSIFSGRRYRLALTVSDKSLSPFSYKNGGIYLKEHLIALSTLPEKDTCTDSYWRKGGKHLTLNSNSRSNCRGCKFCGTYSLERNDRPLDTYISLREKAEELDKENKLNKLESIGVVTGCFPNEEKIVKHLGLVRQVFSEFGFRGEIQYIGSQIHSLDSICKLLSQGAFAYYLTIESFTNRPYLMKKDKANFSLEDDRHLLAGTKRLGGNTSFLYIAGLDPLEFFAEELEKYKNIITRLPLFQTFQIYQPNQIAIRCTESAKADYFLKMRQIIEKKFPNLQPNLSLNYRSLWFSEYNRIPIIQSEL